MLKNDILIKICQEIKVNAGNAMLVGGAVRDALLGIACKDMDIEVYGLAADKLKEILSQYGKVEEVGMSFGVMKLRLNGEEFDFSLPRRENKQGKGHKGFIVAVDPTMTPKEAAARRDFTINSMAIDILENKLFDFYGGHNDLSIYGTLRPTSEAFKEDPLRVLRGMQFAGRFQLWASPLLIEYAKEMHDEYATLAKERVWAEWEKFFSKSVKPSHGLHLLNITGWINHYPELAALKDIQQDNEWHPEGDALLHTLYVVDAAAEIALREKLSSEARLILVAAALCHDLGKAVSTVFKNERWRSPGHDVSGVPLAESFLRSIGCPEDIALRILKLCRWHMAHCWPKITAKAVRKLSVNLSPVTIEELLLLIEADYSGRPPLPKGLPAKALELHTVASTLGVRRTKCKAIIRGADLINKGLTPGPSFGGMLKEIFSYQLNGDFSEENADSWLDNYLAKR
jgi:tRNA nucleotidyltransferase (CCA-adding enzyme)